MLFLLLQKDIRQCLRFEPSLIKISFCSKVHVIQVIKLFSYNNDASKQSIVKKKKEIINWINKLIFLIIFFPCIRNRRFLSLTPSQKKNCFSLSLCRRDLSRVKEREMKSSFFMTLIKMSLFHKVSFITFNFYLVTKNKFS